jgi:hypothetical protein
MELIAQDTHHFGGDCLIQQGNCIFDFALVIQRYRALNQMFPRLAAYFLDVA